MTTANVVSLPDVDTYYMGIAVAVQAKANCLGSRVGAVIVLQNRVISTGYNGVPEGMTNCMDRVVSGAGTERNNFNRGPATTSVSVSMPSRMPCSRRRDFAVEGATVYTTMRHCFGCGKELLQAKVKRVVYRDLWTPPDPDPEMARQKLEEYTRLLAEFDDLTHWSAS